MKSIAIVGTRGIPANHGGYETFAQEVSPLLVKYGFKVTVYCDKSLELAPPKIFKQVNLHYLPITKSQSPLKYYFYSLRDALKSSDIVVVTGTAGSLFYGLNIFFRKIIITNTDGIESRREKWSWFKRIIIRFTEILAVMLSSHLIADSNAIREYLKRKYPYLSELRLSTIEYGAYINTSFDEQILDKYSLRRNNYFLVVSRIEPENNLMMIIAGYKRSLSSKPLIIIGNLKSNNYSKALILEQNGMIRFLGGIYDNMELNVLRYSAFAHIHGHSVGGTNPSLLEAMGSRNVVICHDNIFNREVTANNQLYFSDNESLGKLIQFLDSITVEELDEFKEKALERITNYYNWQNIADKYITVIKTLI